MSAPYKPRVERKFVGGYRPRIDAAEKAHGRATYADDLTSRRHFPICSTPRSCEAPIRARGSSASTPAKPRRWRASKRSSPTAIRRSRA